MGQAWEYSTGSQQVGPYAAVLGPQFAYAGFFLRLMASLIDGLIVLVLAIGAILAFTWWVGPETANQNGPVFGLFVRLIVVALGWIYYATLESGPKQSTFGKRVFGLKVADISGDQISFLRASVRYFSKFLSQAICMIGYLMMLGGSTRQCLHDMISGCVVVETW